MSENKRQPGIMLPLMFCIFVVIVGVLLVLELKFNRRSDHVRETWRTSNGEITIEVTVFSEQYSPLPGVYYVFEVVDSNGDRKEIMDVRRDDPHKINREGVVFVDDETAYIYEGRKYGVTTDGGENWTVWDARKWVSNWQCCGEGFINKVEINRDGVGKMETDQMPHSRDKKWIWRTNDYGRKWILSTRN